MVDHGWHSFYLLLNLVNAELCKISVNTYVTTKISYANMLADICDRLPGAELVLNATDLNVLIGENPDLKGKLFVEFDDDQVKGKVSMPLPDIGPLKLKGRYLNGQFEDVIYMGLIFQENLPRDAAK